MPSGKLEMVGKMQTEPFGRVRYKYKNKVIGSERRMKESSMRVLLIKKF